MSQRYGNSHVIQNMIKNNNGEIIGYSLENGEIIMTEEAESLRVQGKISDALLDIDEKFNK